MLLSCEGARRDPEWLARMLWPPISAERARDELPHLLQTRDPETQWLLLGAGGAKEGEVRKTYHQAMKEHGARALVEPAPPAPILAFALTLPWDEPDERVLHDLLYERVEALGALCGAAKERPDMVVQLNVQGWALTRL